MGSGRMAPSHGGATTDAADAPFPLGPMRAISRMAEKVEGAVLVVVLLTMVTLAFSQVLLRQISARYPAIQPVSWFGPFTQHLVVGVGIIGASIATREGRHFGVEALTKSFGVRGRRRLDLVLQLVSCALTAIIAVLAWNHLLLRELKAESPVFEVDSLHHLKVWRWQLIAIVPVELTFMVYRFALRALEALMLDDATWDEHDKSLRPELEAAPVTAVVEPAHAAPPVVEKVAPPPPPKEPPPPPPPEVKAPDPAPAASAPAEPARPPERKKSNTEEVRVYRIADTGDVVEPEVRPGEPPPPDDDTALVDSEASEGDEPLDARDAGATTQRADNPEETGSAPNGGGA